MGQPTSGGKGRPAQSHRPTAPPVAAPSTAAHVANSDVLACMPGPGVTDETPWLSASVDALALDANEPFAAATGGTWGPAGEDALNAHGPDVLRRVDAQVDVLATACTVLLSQRQSALHALEADTVPEPVPDHLSDLVAVSAGLALGAATAGIGGAIGAAAATSFGGVLAKEFVKSAVKDVVDDGLNTAVRSAVRSSMAQGADARTAFFRAGDWPLDQAKILVAQDVHSWSRQAALLRLPDPVGALVEMTSRVEENARAAFALQYRGGMLAWLDLLAQCDLGTAGPGRTDMLGTFADDLLGTPLFGTEPRGVLRLSMFNVDPSAAPHVTSAAMSGTNRGMLASLAAETPATAGLPIEVDADLGWMSAKDEAVLGHAEIGEDEAGRGGVLADDTAREHLAGYGGRGPDDASEASEVAVRAGAERLMAQVRNQTFAQLGVEVG